MMKIDSSYYSCDICGRIDDHICDEDGDYK